MEKCFASNVPYKNDVKITGTQCRNSISFRKNIPVQTSKNKQLESKMLIRFSSSKPRAPEAISGENA